MSLLRAKRDAAYYSSHYHTFWYVRCTAPNVYEPYAHDSEDERTVATFYNGEEQ